MAASKAAAAVVANKYARIPLAPLCGDVSTQTGLRLQACRSFTREAMRLESASADLLRPVALRPRTRDQFRADEVIKYIIAVPAVAAGHESAVDAVERSSTRHLRRTLWTCVA
jgi:hypothetical protein